MAPDDLSVGNSASVSAPTGHHYQRDLDALWFDVLALAAAVEDALIKSVRSLTAPAPELVADVKADEQRIDHWEVRIEHECLRVLALYGPVASDLRRVAVVIKINGDLERMSDLAEHIAKRARKLTRAAAGTSVPPALTELAESALGQVRAALRALRENDPTQARDVIPADKKVDKRLRAAVKEFKQAIRRDPDQLETYLRVMNTARNLERAADLAANIARAVIYLKEGDIIRHADLHHPNPEIPQ
jgi:phosphate transport system protein